jgi:hypothetical protein
MVQTLILQAALYGWPQGDDFTPKPPRGIGTVASGTDDVVPIAEWEKIFISMALLNAVKEAKDTPGEGIRIRRPTYGGDVMNDLILAAVPNGTINHSKKQWCIFPMMAVGKESARTTASATGYVSR